MYFTRTASCSHCESIGVGNKILNNITHIAIRMYAMCNAIRNDRSAHTIRFTAHTHCAAAIHSANNLVVYNYIALMFIVDNPYTINSSLCITCHDCSTLTRTRAMAVNITSAIATHIIVERPNHVERNITTLITSNLDLARYNASRI